MSAEKIMRLPTGSYRLHRFPPLAQPVKAPDDRLLDDEWQDTQVDIQQQLEAGFQQGLQQGYDEGLRQGLEQGKQQGIIDGQKEGFQKGFVSGESPVSSTFWKPPSRSTNCIKPCRAGRRNASSSSVTSFVSWCRKSRSRSFAPN